MTAYLFHVLKNMWFQEMGSTGYMLKCKISKLWKQLSTCQCKCYNVIYVECVDATCLWGEERVVEMEIFTFYITFFHTICILYYAYFMQKMSFKTTIAFKVYYLSSKPSLKGIQLFIKNFLFQNSFKFTKQNLWYST